MGITDSRSPTLAFKQRALFLTTLGNPMHPNNLTALVRSYLTSIGITRRGSCHMLRHTTATLMLEGGADTLPPVRLVDFHCELTSEKNAFGLHLDGRVSAVVGTHTHIPTADARVLPKGTAYITDLGMTGPYDSIIGFRADKVLRRFKTFRHAPFEVAKRDVRLAAALVTADSETGHALAIEALQAAEGG